MVEQVNTPQTPTGSTETSNNVNPHRDYHVRSGQSQFERRYFGIVICLIWNSLASSVPCSLMQNESRFRGICDRDSGSVSLYLITGRGSAIMYYNAYRKKGFCLSVRSSNAILSRCTSSNSKDSRILFSRRRTRYNTTAAVIVMQ